MRPPSACGQRVPILSVGHLSRRAPRIGKVQQIAEAIPPVANRDLTRFGLRLVVVDAFPAQVLVCWQPPCTPDEASRVRQICRSVVLRGWVECGDAGSTEVYPYPP